MNNNRTLKYRATANFYLFITDLANSLNESGLVLSRLNANGVSVQINVIEGTPSAQQRRMASQSQELLSQLGPPQQTLAPMDVLDASKSPTLQRSERLYSQNSGPSGASLAQAGATQDETEVGSLPVGALNFKEHLMRVGELHLCKVCNYSSKHYSHVRRHIITIHLGVRPFKCNYCPMSFCDNYKRTRHERKKHLGAVENLQIMAHVPCPHCGDQLTLFDLQHHMATQHGMTLNSIV